MQKTKLIQNKLCNKYDIFLATLATVHFPGQKKKKKGWQVKKKKSLRSHDLQIPFTASKR